MTVASQDVPLDSQTVQTDHAVQFRGAQEDERPEQTVVVGVNGGEVRADIRRVREHRGNVRENHASQDDSGHDLNNPQRGVAVSEELPLAVHVVEHAVARRETTQSHESVDDDQQRDGADQSDVHPSIFLTVDRVTTGESAQVPENVLTQLDRARESHVAEQEDTQQQASNGLSNVTDSRPLALANSLT